MTHTLKTIQPYFDQVAKGNKAFELRKFDRQFSVGDWLILQEYNQVDKVYSGREITTQIKYLLSDCMELGLMKGFVILGLGPTAHNF